MSYYINKMKDRNEKTLPNTCLTIPDCPSHIDRNEESWCLRDFDQDSVVLKVILSEDWVYQMR